MSRPKTPALIFLSSAVWLSCLLFGQDQDDLRRLLENAVELHQSGRLEEAVQAYQTFLEKGPALPLVMSNLGAAYSGLGNHTKAIEFYQKALGLEENASIRLNLAIALYKAADLDAAIGELETVIAAEPENQRAILLLADCHFRMGENQKVIDVLSPLADQVEEDLAIAYLLGTSLIRSNRIEEGQRIIDRILSRGDSAEAHLLMGSAHQMGNEIPKAVEEFRKAVELNPMLPGAHSLLGRALLMSGDQEGAMDAFRGELKRHPNDFDANFYLGVLAKNDHRYEEASLHLESCALLRPKALEVRYQIALLHLMTGKADEARRLLEEIVEKAPRFVEAHVSLATAYYRLNLKEKGDERRAMVLKLNAQRQAEQPGASDDLGPAYRGDDILNIPKPPQESEP